VYISLDASDSVLGSSHDEARETEIVLIIVRPTSPLLLSIYWTTSLLLLVLAPLDLDYTVWAQQEALSQDSIENTTTQIANRLNTIIELLEQARQGSIIQLYITIIVFMMGLAFVIFGLYIGQEQKLSVFTKRLYLIAYFALIVPITIILVRYVASTLLSDILDDPLLLVALLLLIPVTASYILMVVKSRHDIVRH
jgi:hypothetical protein